MWCQLFVSKLIFGLACWSPKFMQNFIQDLNTSLHPTLPWLWVNMQLLMHSHMIHMHSLWLTEVANLCAWWCIVSQVCFREPSGPFKASATNSLCAGEDTQMAKDNALVVDIETKIATMEQSPDNCAVAAVAHDLVHEITSAIADDRSITAGVLNTYDMLKQVTLVSCHRYSSELLVDCKRQGIISELPANVHLSSAV